MGRCFIINEQLRKMIPLQELMESVCEIYPK